METCSSLITSFEIDGIFVMGDFNAEDTHHNLKPLMESKFKFASCRQKAKFSDHSMTFHKFKGDSFLAKMVGKVVGGYAVIDHIFFSSVRFEAEKFHVLKSHKPYMSDHHPVVATFSVE